MSSKIKVLQVIPKLGFGGAETGCYDLAHYLYEQNCKSYIATSGGELLKYVDKKKVKIIKLPVHSKNPLLILFNSILLFVSQEPKHEYVFSFSSLTVTNDDPIIEFKGDHNNPSFKLCSELRNFSIHFK